MPDDRKASSGGHAAEEVTGVHSYVAFGLRIRSERELPELEPASEGPPDIRIRFSHREPQDGLSHAFLRTPDGGARFEWPGLGTYLVDGSGNIDVCYVQTCHPRLMRLPLLGVVLAHALRQRGVFTLHASSVAFGGKAVLFAGDKGAGKSTICAAALGAGGRMLTDDVAALVPTGTGTCAVVPGFPQIKIEQRAADALLAPGLPLEPFIEGHPKHAYRVPGSFLLEQVPAAALFLLSRGRSAGVRSVPPVERFMALQRFSYLARFPDQFSRDEELEQFRTVSNLARGLPVFELVVPDEIERIPEAIRQARNAAGLD